MVTWGGASVVYLAHQDPRVENAISLQDVRAYLEDCLE